MTPMLYEGTKRLYATPMTRGEYNAYRGWENPAGENPADSGYLVEYQDGGKANDSRHAGYISWSPADVFERTYKPVSAVGMTFGQALEAIKAGQRIARTGWNGKGMFVYLVPPASYPVQTGAAKAHFGEGALVPYNAYMAIKNVDNTVSTWVPSVNDCLATDWGVVGESERAAEPVKPAPITLPVVDPGPDSLEREIQAKANRAPRVTPVDVKAEIVGETFTLLPSGRVTVCELTLKNGFTVRGESAVVFIENFDEGIGRKVARDNAEKEVWQLLGFRLRDEQADAAADLADVKLVPPHQQRVLDEKRELDERLSKLDAFILDNPLYLQLPTDEQDRLSRQSKAMAGYSGILDERIAKF